MIRFDAEAVRTFLHLLAVAVWVGGQIVVAGVVTRLRPLHREALPVVAQTFGRVAWIAMVVIVATGLWGLADVEVADQDSAYLVTLFIKMALVGLALASALVHQVGRTRLALAIGGLVGLLASLGAMALGVLLVHGA